MEEAVLNEGEKTFGISIERLGDPQVFAEETKLRECVVMYAV